MQGYLQGGESCKLDESAAHVQVCAIGEDDEETTRYSEGRREDLRGQYGIVNDPD
jgi:hypothetical protein